MLGISKHRQSGSKTVGPVGSAGVQIGKAIISPETMWVDSEGNVVFSTLPVSTAFSAVDYPILSTMYPSLVTPALAQEPGAPYPYRIIADLQE